ncbi:MAG: hypothetical protein R3312_04505 [Gammaproteobacteria bacterium]|nr:hypothetical protein [Gammaproteobacteria bacterium]
MLILKLYDWVRYEKFKFLDAIALKSFIFSILLVLLCSPVVQAAVATQAEQVQIEQNYSYAPYLGAGIYGSRTDDRDIFVLNVPVSYYLVDFDEYTTEPQEADWGLKLNTTISVGFFDYDPEESLPELDIPTEVGTLVILPGIEYIAPINDSWRLQPFLDLGVGRNFEAKTTNLIYGFGVKSYFHFDIGKFPFLLGNRLYQAGFKNKHLDTSDSFAVFETGLNMTVARGSLFGRETDLGLYYMNFIFSDNLNLSDISEKADTANIQNEIGFSFGATRPVEHTLVGRPRIGMGVRFIDGDQLYRLFLGFPFF